MQSKDFDEVLCKLGELNYVIKRGKYIAVKPPEGSQFIRLKSLGEHYIELAISNRLVNKFRFVNDLNVKINAAKNHARDGRSDSLETMIDKNILHFMNVFVYGVLPMNKVNKKKPFTWTNCAELDKLSELNKKINAGLTLDSLRNKFAMLEKSVIEKRERISALKTESKFFDKLHNAAIGCFVFESRNLKDRELLKEYEVTSENYERIPELITANEFEIGELEKSLSEDRAVLKDTSDTLTLLEKVVNGTYLQTLIEEEKERRQANYIGTGFKLADGSNAARVEAIGAKLLDSGNPMFVEPTAQVQPPPRTRKM